MTLCYDKRAMPTEISSQATVKNSISFSEHSERPALPNPTNLLGIGIHGVRHQQALDQIETWIKERKPRHICLANAYSVSLCWDYPGYRATLDSADLVLADGMSIVWGGRWLGIHIPERIAGPDLTRMLCERAQEMGYGMFFLGSTAENLQLLISVLKRRYPKLRIVGSYSPSMCDRFSAEENRTIVRKIHEASPDILLVGISAPKQEIWIAEHLQDLNVPICMGIGAAFDFLSGRIPRAPGHLQKIGLEWLHRLSCEPRRLWKRYLLGNAIFLSHLTYQWFRRRWRLLMHP
jgi:N-acetylglucosaminyldiphosphoundecaprenol N-acetyl-beta-D-mannosaminyltransferase